MAAEGMDFPWQWTSGTIPLNLRIIWGMSVETIVGDDHAVGAASPDYARRS